MRACRILSIVLFFVVSDLLYSQASCPIGYVPAALSTSLSTNGTFSNVSGTTGSGGLSTGSNPSTTVGTNYTSIGFWSQARRCTNDAYTHMACGAPNEFTLASGAKNWVGGLVRINPFPGDPANNVPALNTYYYSNGNDLGGEYLLWEQTISGMTIGRTYTFSCYVNNAIDTTLSANCDPIIRLRVGGSNGLPNGTLVSGPIALTEAMCAPNQPLGGWVRIEYSFTATSTSQVFKVTDAAANGTGDDFALTAVTVVGCIPNPQLIADTPCIGDTLHLSVVNSSTNSFTYNWSGPNNFSYSGSNIVRANMSSMQYGTYTVTITDTFGVSNTKSIHIPEPSQPVNNTATTNLCENNMRTLSGTPQGGTWSIVSGAGYLNSNIYIPSSVISDSTTILRYSIGKCHSEVSFTINNLEIAQNLTSTDTICESTTKILNGIPSGGSWSVLSGGGFVSGNIYSPPNIASNTLARLRYTIPANGACPANSDDTSFIVNFTNGVASNNTSPNPICESSSKALSASPPGGIWTIISGGGSISGNTYIPSDISNNTEDTIRYTIAANGKCASTTSDIHFTVNSAPPVAVNSTSTSDICENGTKNLVGSPAGGTWSVLSGGGTITGNTYTPANISSNTQVSVRYSIAANGVCPGTTSDVSFTVNVKPLDSANTTSTNSVCESASKVLTSSMSGGTWSIISGGGTIAGSTYTPANVNSNTLVTIRYTIPSNGACAAAISDRTFQVDSAPPAVTNSTSTADVCETAVRNLVGYPSGGSWSIITGGGTISGSTYTPPNISANTTIAIRYSLTSNGTCPASFSDKSFTVNSFIGVASNTTTNTAICETETKMLSGSPSGGSWSLISGNGTIGGTTYTSANIGSNNSVTIRYTIPVNGACPSSTSDISFLVHSQDSAKNTTDSSRICEIDTKMLVGSPSGGSWSISSGGGTINGSTYTPANVSNNTYITVRYTIPNNGACTTAKSSEVQFLVNSQDTAKNKVDTSGLCESATKSLVGTPTGGSWSILSGGGTISGASYIPPNIVSNSQVTLRYSIPANGACTTAKFEDVSFILYSQDTARNNIDTASICETSSKSLIASPTGGTWSIVTGNGTINGNNYTPTNVNANTLINIRYSIPANGNCIASSSERSFVVNSEPGIANNSTSTSDICETSTKTLQGTPASGTWNVVSGGGTITGSTYTPANVSSNSSVTIRYTISANGACVGSSADRSFTVNYDLGTATNSTTTSSICESDTKTLLGSPSGGTWSILSGGGSVTGNTYSPSNIASNASVTLRYSIPANGACSNTIADKSFNVNFQPPIASNITQPNDICETSSKLLQGSPMGGTWSVLSGGGSITDSIYTPANVSANTLVTVRYTVNANGVCPATHSDVSFTVNPNPGAAVNSTSNAAICETSTKQLIGSPSGGTWSIIGGSGIVNGNTFTPNGIDSDSQVVLRYTIAAVGACPATNSDISFTINSDPGIANNSTSSDRICENGIKALVGSPSNGSWSIVQGGGSISGTLYTPSNISSNSNVTVRYIIASNGACPGTSSDISFGVDYFPGLASNETDTSAICETQTKLLKGVPEGGTWSILEGGGVISNSLFSPADTSSNSRVTIRYTIDANGACVRSNSDLSFLVNFHPGNAVNQTDTSNICETATKLIQGAPSNGQWSLIQGIGTINNGVYYPSNIEQDNSVTIRYLIPSNGACLSSYADQSFIVNYLPDKAQVDTINSSLCSNESKKLNGLPNGGDWTIVSGGGSIFNENFYPASSNVDTSVIIRYSIKANGQCPSSFSDLILPVRKAPEKPILVKELTVCSSDTLILYSKVRDSGVSYKWSGPNNYETSTQIPVLANLTPEMSGEYVVVLSKSNCKSDPSSTNITVKKTPNVPVLTSNGPLCDGDTLKISSAATTDQLNYSWYFQNEMISNARVILIPSARISNSGTYKLIHDLEGCITSNSIDILVNERPTAPKLLSNGPVCAGKKLIISAENSNSLSQYSWMGPGGFASTLKEVSIDSPLTENNGTYSLKVGYNQCWSSPGTIEVLVKEKPLKPILQSNSPVCEGKTLQLSALNPDTRSTYQWIGSNNFTSESSSVDLPHANQNFVGKYFFYQSTNGCNSDTSELEVSVIENPIRPVHSDSIVVQKGKKLILEITTPSTTTKTFSWRGENGYTSQTQSNIIESASEMNGGDYYVTQIDRGCSSEETKVSVRIVDKIVRIVNSMTPNGDGIFDNFTIYGLEYLKSNKLTIYDATNRIVYQKLNYNNDWDGVNPESGNLPEGTYYYVFEYTLSALENEVETGNVLLIR